MIETQDPKYAIHDDKIVNVATSEPIPDDEPIFILRAKDMLAPHVIQYYQNLCATNEHKAAIDSRIHDFNQFQRDNPDRVKMPDTVFPYPGVKAG